MIQWRCNYCMKDFYVDCKSIHVQTARHKFKARWAKYFLMYDELIKQLDEDKKLLNYSPEEYETKEAEIIKELDELLVAGLFDNYPDSD